MIRTFLTLSASVAALAFAVPSAAQDDAGASKVPEMTFGTWGFDPASIDQAINPGDDFYAYVNGKWAAENPLSPEFTRYGSFDMLQEKSTSEVKALIDELAANPPAAGTSERRVLDAYQAYFDLDAINARGLAPAQPYLQAIYTAKDLGELAELFPKPGYSGLVSAVVTVDDKDPDSYIVSVGFDGMGLPSREFYLTDSDRMKEVQAAYKKYLAFMLSKAGYEDPDAAAEAVYAFEHKVAELEWARAALRNPDVLYNKLTRGELEALAPEFPTKRVLEAGGFDGQDTFLVRQILPTPEEIEQYDVTPEMLAQMGGGLPAMMKLLAETPLATLKAYMAAQFLSSHSSVLPSELYDARFALYGKLLSGQQEPRARWKRAIGAAESEVGELVGKAYADRYFPPESKAAMLALVGNLRKAIRESIAANTWMSDATKREATAKIDALTPMIGYPDKFETYDGLAISPSQPLGNMIAAGEWERRKNLSRLGKPVDRTEWGLLPETVNAYYQPVFNQAVFPAAILQPPFFDPNADPAVNYGAIGAGIGHEVGHGFDDQGSKYDAGGKLNNWWQPADKERFQALVGSLAAQYDTYCPYDDGKICVNGRLGLGEAIGDLSGLTFAYRAYHLSLGGEEAPVIDGLTGDQRFFLSFAQLWRSLQREESERQQMLTDPHSPDRFRVNGTVRNMDAWYAAFGVRPGDKLYLAPDERVRIWDGLAAAQ